MIEHTGGRFPLWLAPDQVSVLPISDKFNTFAQEVAELLKSKKYRVFYDDRNEKIGKKIRESELQRIPYSVIIGEKESAERTVSVRARGGVDLGSMSLDAFVAHLDAELARSFDVKK